MQDIRDSEKIRGTLHEKKKNQQGRALYAENLQKK